MVDTKIIIRILEHVERSAKITRRLIYYQAAPKMEAWFFKIKSSNGLANTIAALLYQDKCFPYSLLTSKQKVYQVDDNTDGTPEAKNHIHLILFEQLHPDLKALSISNTASLSRLILAFII